MTMFYEYEAKQMFHDNGIPTPKFQLYTDSTSIKVFCEKIGQPSFMAKAQCLAGGRGKAGLIKKVTENDAEEYIKSIIGKEHKGKPVELVMLEEPMEIEKEYYLTVMMNNNEGNYSIICSSMGGVDIEAVAEEHPEAIHTQTIDIDIEPFAYKFMALGKTMKFEGRLLNQFSSILANMVKMAQTYDLNLIEINPLILTKQGKLVAADAKVAIDGNAYFRQKKIAQLKSQRDQHTDLEHEATEAGISYVELDGDIGIIAGGAGLSMATCDLFEHYDSSPANFLDVGGGADRDKVDKALDILTRQNVKGIFVNIFAGITRCDEVAHGIISAKERLNIETPMVIRLVGTNDIQGIEILKEKGIDAYGEMRPAAQKIVELAKGGN